MDEQPGREFEVDVKPGFAVTMALLVLVFAWFHFVATRRFGAPVPLAESLNWGASVTVLVLLGTMIHELGHVAAGLAAGHQWTKAVLNGAGLGVVIEPRPRGWDRVLRSAAGPFAHLLFALPLLAVAWFSTPGGELTASATQTSVWWVGGISSLFLAVLNALPVPGFDGAKILEGVRELSPRRTVVARRFAKT
ncbi:MAG: hypothetical protein QM779_12045 [Propionicimonas sp.]|uniref:metalloprotease n=1 Tax=Propionicimonas sp. TaxID=1955623 RepID=UPI003D0F2B12